MTVQLPVPMNDLKRVYQRFQVEIEKAVLDVMRSGWWLNGASGQRFCRNFADYIGGSECIAVANGTDALELAFRSALHVSGQRGLDVILAANAGGYAATACRQVGLTPKYVDVEYASQLISIPEVLAATRESTSAIVVTHLYGGVVDVRAIKDGLARAGFAHVPVIEDCAQAHGAKFGDAKVGSLGDVATFSFYPTKNLGAMGDGGAVVTSDVKIASHVRQLQQYGWGGKYRVVCAGGRNSRMDELHAATLDILLKYLDLRNDERRRILRRYRSAAKDRLKFVDGGDGHVAHLAVILCEDRDSFREFMKSRGIETDIHYPILDCDQPGWVAQSHEAEFDLPVSRRSVGQLCSIPCFPELRVDEVERVVASIAEWESR